PAIQCQLSRCSVRPPSADLRHEELLVQSADSLAEVAGLGSRLAEQRAECDRLRRRAADCQAKIDFLKRDDSGCAGVCGPEISRRQATRRQLFCRPSPPEGRGRCRDCCSGGRSRRRVRRVAAQHEGADGGAAGRKSGHYMMLPLRPPGAQRAAAAEGLGRPPPGCGRSAACCCSTLPRIPTGSTACWIRSALSTEFE
uniref:Tektin n=1 Tax=Macrostomum lignano TaxID=282301 RepID=A0A1I8FAX9_9PLAT